MTKTGTFRTLRRQVEVTIEEITVTNDSDNHSACDCTFQLEVDGKVGYWPDNTSGDGAQIPTGGTVHPNLRITVRDTPDSVLLRIFGRDNDKTGSTFQSCAGGVPELVWGSGSNAC